MMIKAMSESYERIMYKIVKSSYREERKGNKDFNTTDFVTMLFLRSMRCNGFIYPTSNR